MDSTTNNSMNFSEELLNLIKERDSERIKQILEDSSLYHSTDAQGATLLHYSVQYKNVKLAKFLLDKGCDANIQDKEGITPLMIAVMKNREKLIKILLAAGANIFILNNKKLSALHMLSAQHKMKSNTIRPFLKKLKKRCCTLKEAVEKLIDNGYYLYQVILLKDYKIIEYMLKRGVPVNSVNPANKVTAMHVAVLLDDFKSVNLLVKYGADVNSLDVMNANPLFFLYSKYPKHNDKKIEILKMILNRGASMTSCTIEGIFQAHYMLIRGNRTVLRLLIESGLDFNIKDDLSNKSVLHYLACNPNAGVVEELKCCTKKLHVNTLDEFGQSPLIIAIKQGNVDMVKFLLKQGARTDIAHNTLGFTPLYYAYDYEKPELEYQYHQCGEILLQHNADPQLVIEKNGETITIFDAALKNNDAERMKPVVAHLAVLEKLGTPITKTTWEKINSDVLLKQYFHECQQLLSHKISEHVMLFDLLVSDKRKMAQYLNNENIVENLKNKSCERRVANHGYYYNALNRCYVKGKRFGKLKDKAAGFICKIFQKRIDKKHLIVENVIKYLNDQSLHQLNQLYRQSSCRRLYATSKERGIVNRLGKYVGES